MDYLRIYNQLIEHRKVLPKLEGIYYEKHHIVPRCMGGGDEEENLVWLTSRDHCIAHLLLAFAFGGKLWFAATAMGLIVGGRKGECARLIAIARKRGAEFNSGLNNTVSDKKVYEFRDVVSGEVFSTTRAELSNKYGITNIDAYMLVSGRVKVCRGIALASTELNNSNLSRPYAARGERNTGTISREYAFKRLSDNEIVVGTRLYMADTHGLDMGSSLKLMNCKCKSARGFVFIGQVVGGEVVPDLKVASYINQADTRNLKQVKQNSAKQEKDGEIYRWVRLSDGHILEKTRRQMLIEFNLSLAASLKMVKGKAKTYKGFYLEGANIRNESVDHKNYEIRHIESGDVLTVTRRQMMHELGLTRGQATNLTQGIAYNNGGYCLTSAVAPADDNLWPDKNVYTFQIIETGELLFKTRKQMFDEYGFTSQQITNLKNGHIKSSKGIRMLREVPFDTSQSITLPLSEVLPT